MFIIDEYVIRPHRDAWYKIRVIVYASKKDMMMAHKRERGLKRVQTRFSGITEGYRKQRFVRNKWRTLPEIATIRLSTENMTVGVVSHEAIHAALRWHCAKNKTDVLDMKSINEVTDYEETVAWVGGYIVSRIFRRANARKY